MKKINVRLGLSLLFVLLLLVAAVMAGCGGQTENVAVNTTAAEIERTVVGEGEKNFDFTAVFADGKTEDYTVFTNSETVGEALLSLGLIEGEMGAYGIYVKSVCGVVADYDVDKTYWALYTDGEMSMTGADKVNCDDVSLVEFKVEK